MIKPISKPRPMKKGKKGLTTQQKRKKLQNKADRLYQEVGRELDAEKGCLLCGEDYSCQHHFFPKSTCSALRYNRENGIRIGVKCHCRIHSSDDPSLNLKIIEIKGKEWLENLLAIKRNTFVKTSLEYYNNVIDNLEKLK